MENTVNNISANKGFTLIELMIAVAVLAILAAVAIPAYNGYIRTTLESGCIQEVASIRIAEEEFFSENNGYFAGAGIAALQANSLTIYQNNTPAVDRHCTYAVVVAGNTYTVTATGANKLAGQGVIITQTY